MRTCPEVEVKAGMSIDPHVNPMVACHLHGLGSAYITEICMYRSFDTLTAACGFQLIFALVFSGVLNFAHLVALFV